ncbi:winged helix-turn-helix transcriptional regulator [Clostridium sp. D2Q-11]|uniref:Winged helix-turn-helix transcriptional regulator n=1 Tax=Anaeromonas frigoriresistens TaxID=2683708 RepID=A0A942Z9T9_9FIRM|nr:metalloregulator ArsR/SmtB family transcription factor [Anaeromonas frigoriresistens]MBS4539180.1 winged helix-turn-helix transcriptional regulator [Anaeromonas frigoriresistens]
MAKEIEVCNCNEVHENIISEAKTNLPKDECLFDLADFFKVFGDSTRIKIIYALLQSEMCVCDIAELLNMSQSAISHQLRTLKNHGVVKYRREGRVVYYSLDDDHISEILNQGFTHICHKK